jgi:hypothetical protein
MGMGRQGQARDCAHSRGGNAGSNATTIWAMKALAMLKSCAGLAFNASGCTGIRARRVYL